MTTALRSEKIDTRSLLRGEAGDANLVDPRRRLSERERVLDYWPEMILSPVRDGTVAPPPWRLLLDPTGWYDVPREEVHGYVYERLVRGFWPSLDGLRRRFGRVSNHRGPDEVPEQTSLLD